ncbi:MAG: undecaprenyldiphospho-muramoylpentapeptide beta-N-acetylglucosaminyltransferase [Fimbriimonadales bacterium]|nr:undecaprenyldiphospho-muramoylpentapeptide beta-N-acetylglucosaminyltransferase [Fimbriimonadales bacterium]
MRLVVTGGGTGGHVYPALEVAAVAKDAGAEVRFIGSNRGIEGKECASRSIEFDGLGTMPIAKLTTLRGMQSAVAMLKAIPQARKLLNANKPEVVFSTGGYAAGPVVSAAKSQRIPIVIHEQNTIPGRTHRVAGRFARRVCYVFDETREWFACPSVRTGMPLRRELCQLAVKHHEKVELNTLIFGGSQGAAAINKAVLDLVMLHGEMGSWTHVTGPSLFDETVRAFEERGVKANYRSVAYLSGEEMAQALAAASIAICRAGAGTLCELALFGIPAVLIPYPYAQGDHQYHNAKAIEKVGGARVMRQSEMTPEKLSEYWLLWARDASMREAASESLLSWSIADAADRVWSTLLEVANES